VPSYPSGQIGFLICSKDKDVDFSNPIHDLSQFDINLRYYSIGMHKCAFTLPPFVQKELENA